MPIAPILVCNQCDLVQREPFLKAGDKARCVGCANILYRSQPNGLKLSLVFTITSAVLFLISNAFPIVTISSQGLTSSTTLLQAVSRLIQDGIPTIAILVLITTFLMPALKIMVMMYLLISLSLGRVPPGLAIGFRLICIVKPWAMIEVFMIGLLVTITKLNAFASVSPDIALIAFVLLMISVTMATSNFDAHAFWREVESIQNKELQAS